MERLFFDSLFDLVCMGISRNLIISISLLSTIKMYFKQVDKNVMYDLVIGINSQLQLKVVRQFCSYSRDNWSYVLPEYLPSEEVFQIAYSTYS